MTQDETENPNEAEALAHSYLKLQRGSVSLAAAIALMFGFMTSQLLQDERPLQAAPRSQPKQAAFESGGARAAKTLQEIKEILTRIDGRLERIEKNTSLRAK